MNATVHSINQTEDSEERSLALLIKLLKMTTAANDGEALAAIRRANVILGRLGGDWESLLRGKVTIVADPFATIQAPPSRTNEDRPAQAPTVPNRPPRPAPQPAPTPRVRTNDYAGHCIHCGKWLVKNAGELTRISGQWKVMCFGAQCPPKSSGPKYPKINPRKSIDIYDL